MKSENVLKPKVLLLPLALAALALLGCVVTPTPPPTPTFLPEGPPTIQIAPTPTPPRVSTPTPQTVQLPGGVSFKQYAHAPLMTIDPQQTYTATLTTDRGNIVIALFASETPVTVNNFVFLAREKFYDGVTIHRVMRDFMIQAGDPQGDGTGGPGYRFNDEPVRRSYTRGTVAMANAGPNTNGSQFFIVHGDRLDLSPNYTIFGEVTRGMEVVDDIASAAVQPNLYNPRELSAPVDPVIIQGVEITGGS